jgi:Ni/Co efflux regulator RcnB
MAKIIADISKKIEDDPMKALIMALTASALVAGAAGSANAQDRGYGHDRGDQHAGWATDRGSGHQWRRGERMGYSDWNSARPVDYRRHHLRQPPRGYEWRESNGRYVMAAVATGVIASMLIHSGR